MKHFEISEWADFARGLVPPSRREAMSGHLAAGCRKCRRTADVLREVAPLAAAESRYEAPEFAVHCARAIYALEQPREVRVLENLLGRLVFDSFREPLAAGVRSRHHVTRQSLYEAGEYAVDLCQEHERGSSRIGLAGQIVSRKDPGSVLAGVAVVLSSRGSVLARAVSNRFGEFRMEYPPSRDLRLDVGIEPEHRPAEQCQSGGIGGLQ
jgi:hypothetical protein